MDTNITVRFYRVDRTHSNQVSFESCLDNIASFKRDDDREVLVGGIRVGSVDNSTIGNYQIGDLIRLQSQNLPSLKITGKGVQALKLPDGGHLGHHTAFMYDTTTRMLAYQISNSSVALSRFNLYVDRLCSCGLFDFTPVIKPHELKQLSSMHPKTFLIKVADPEDLDAVSDDQIELQAGLVGMQKAMKGAYVKVQVGMGHYNNNLDKGVVGRAIGWLLEQHAKNKGGVQTVQLKGTMLDGSSADPLNFLRAHVGYSDQLQIGLLSPRQSLQSRLGILTTAFSQNKLVLKGFEKKEF